MYLLRYAEIILTIWNFLGKKQYTLTRFTDFDEVRSLVFIYFEIENCDAFSQKFVQLGIFRL